jgi:hypothetical protein
MEEVMKIIGSYQTVVTKQNLRRLAENNPKVHGEGPFTDEDLEGHPMLGPHTMYVVESDQTATADKMFEYLDRNNLISAAVDHLIFFPRLEHPDVKFPIAVLQSPSWDGWKNPDGSSNYPVAEVTADGRGLVLKAHPTKDSWEGTNRFLALPK